MSQRGFTFLVVLIAILSIVSTVIIGGSLYYKSYLSSKISPKNISSPAILPTTLPSIIPSVQPSNLPLPTEKVFYKVLLQKEPGKSWVETDPMQCGSNPWEQHWLKSHNATLNDYPENQDEKMEIIKIYFEDQGINVSEAKVLSDRDRYGRSLITCGSCSCPAGYTLYLLVPNNKVNEMQKLGFKIYKDDLFNTSCEFVDECEIINKDLDYSTCYPEACQDIDYSKENFIAVNSASKQNYIYRNKPDNCGSPPLCPIQEIIRGYEARCIKNTCQKTPIKP